MINQYYVVEEHSFDPNTFSSQEKNKLQIVSFKIDCLDKYRTNPDYDVPANGTVGVLRNKKVGWDLQIDIHQKYFNTFLYKIENLPDADQQHFVQFNIWPQYLSKTAFNRWLKGTP